MVIATWLDYFTSGLDSFTDNKSVVLVMMATCFATQNGVPTYSEIFFVKSEAVVLLKALVLMKKVQYFYKWLCYYSLQKVITWGAILT